MTILAFSFCDLELWHVILAWLLPFILGLLLGYAIWAKYKREKELLEKRNAELSAKMTALEAQMADCQHEKTARDSEIASLKGRLRERNLQLTTLEASLAAAGKKGASEKKAAKKSPAVPGDDLKKIEGIGPKIENILNAGGITSFSDLAKTSTSMIRTLLDAAGGKFNIADPSTWSQQADLAGKGDWAALKALQDQLKGGKTT
jgi:predicted flap endonuclease-1-like 5' DNA nuclease